MRHERGDVCGKEEGDAAGEGRNGKPLMAAWGRGAGSQPSPVGPGPQMSKTPRATHS